MPELKITGMVEASLSVRAQPLAVLAIAALSAGCASAPVAAVAPPCSAIRRYVYVLVTVRAAGARGGALA